MFRRSIFDSLVKSTSVVASNASPSTMLRSCTAASFSSTAPSLGLEEFIDKTFFDGKSLESAGRAWKVSELRRKSFEDLNKLWFVCLKERNMLLTHRRLAYTMNGQIKHPERIQKVKKTMAGIKRVIFEREQQALQMAREEFEKRKAAGLYKYPIDFSDPEVQRVIEELKSEGAVTEEVALAALQEAAVAAPAETSQQQ